MSRGRSKRVIPDLPIHAVGAPQIIVDRQLLEWKDAAEFQKTVQLRGQEHVEVEVESAEMIDRKIPEEIIPLDGIAEGMKNVPVFWEMRFQELLDLAIIKKEVFEIRIEQRDIGDRRPGLDRQVGALARLDNAFRDLEAHVLSPACPIFRGAKELGSRRLTSCDRPIGDFATLRSSRRERLARRSAI